MLPAFIIIALGAALGVGLCVQLFIQHRASRDAARSSVGPDATSRATLSMRGPTSPVFVIGTPALGSPGLGKRGSVSIPPKTPVTDAEVADWHEELQAQFRRASSPQLPPLGKRASFPFAVVPDPHAHRCSIWSLNNSK